MFCCFYCLAGWSLCITLTYPPKILKNLGRCLIILFEWYTPVQVRYEISPILCRVQYIPNIKMFLKKIVHFLLLGFTTYVVGENKCESTLLSSRFLIWFKVEWCVFRNFESLRADGVNGFSWIEFYRAESSVRWKLDRISHSEKVSVMERPRWVCAI